MKLKQKYLFRLSFIHFHITHKNSAFFSVRNGRVKSVFLFNYYFYFRKPLKLNNQY